MLSIGGSGGPHPCLINHNWSQVEHSLPLQGHVLKVVGGEGVVAAPGAGIHDVLEGNVLLVGLEMLLA